jgi:signal transduction histidine kinase/CheY-like chemotaxis protein
MQLRSGRWRLIDQSLNVQFWIAFGVVALSTFTSLYLQFDQSRLQARIGHWIEKSNQSLAYLNDLSRDLYSQQTTMQEFLMTSETSVLTRIKKDRAEWEIRYQVILQNFLDLGIDRLELNKLRRSYDVWVNLSDKIIKTSQEAKNHETAVDPATFKAETDTFEETIKGIDQVIQQCSQGLKIKEQEGRIVTEQTLRRIIGLNLGLLIIFIMVLVQLYRSVVPPIIELYRNMESFEKGDFGARVLVANQSQVGYLQQSFNEMVEKIDAMVTDLRQLDEMKSDFLSTVSHELRTPLTSIGGYAKLLSSGDVGPISSTQKEFLEIIDKNVSRLTKLINDILDVEKMTAGKMELDLAVEDLREVLEECRDTFGILAAQKGLEFKVKIQGDVLSVRGDRSRLVQLFMNLISNAIKYTDKGFVEVEAEKRDLAIIVRIRDSGIGLDEEDQRKLFQKFYRSRSKRALKESGTGLGLVIVQKIAELHHGNVRVESRLGEGTVFTVSLPASTEAPKKKGRSTGGEKAGAGRTEQTVAVIAGQDGKLSVELKSDLDGDGQLGVERRPEVWCIQSPIAPVGNGEASDSEWTSCSVRLERLMAKTQVKISGKIPKMREITDPLPKLPPGEPLPAMVFVHALNEEDLKTQMGKIRDELPKRVPIVVVGERVDPLVAFAEGASAMLSQPIGEREFSIAFNDLAVKKGMRILVADYDRDSRILIKRELEGRGYLVDDVDRGNQVMGRMQSEDYDLLLMDLNFPDMPGVEVIKIIRRNPRFAHTPVFIMLEGDNYFPSREELASWGADQFLGKYRGIGGIVEAVCSQLEG